MMLLEKLSHTFLWWEANFPRENMRSTARLQSKPILCLNSPLIIDEGQQRNCLSSSCSLGKCSTARFSSRLPLFQGRGPLPVPPTPGWAGNHQLGLALQNCLLGQMQGCSFPLRAAARCSAATAKAHFCNPEQKEAKRFKDSLFSQENIKWQCNSILPQIFQWVPRKIRHTLPIPCFWTKELPPKIQGWETQPVFFCSLPD